VPPARRVLDEAIDWWELVDGTYQPLAPDDAGIVHSHVFPGLRLNLRAMLDGNLQGVLHAQQT
jgi:hypothetical protein